MRYTRPKTIYWFEHKELCRHKVTAECVVEPVNFERADWSGYFRCRVCDGSDRHDHYGFDSIKAAKLNEIRETKRRMIEDAAWVEKLEKQNAD